MRVFVIFGTIEFLHDDENTALVHGTHSCAFMDEDKIEDYATEYDLDYITPHYYNGRITFMQYHKETT